jgi:Putative Ig domain/Domain of unknown function DUF11
LPPAFVTASPPLTATAGSAYGYTFTASGTPAPGYALAGGAPSWLSIDSSTGVLSGTVPSGTTSFSYSVTAANPAGTVTAGPFTVTVSAAPPARADLSARLSCPASVQSGAAGTCGLTVSNAGPAAASNTLAALALSAGLVKTACHPGCTAYGNVLAWKLGPLAAGASAQVTVTFTAGRPGSALVLGVAVSSTLDPRPLNNLALAVVTVKR